MGGKTEGFGLDTGLWVAQTLNIFLRGMRRLNDRKRI